MKNKKTIIVLSALTLITIGGAVWAVSKMTAQPTVNQMADAKLKVENPSHDWGEIGINDGNVSQSFTITNQGNDPLELYNLKTSCSCTTAQLKTGDKVSPLYGMHTSSNYVHQVLPGESTQLEVIYDPLFHGPNGVGAISRQVVIQTNDSAQPQLTFSVKAMVKK